MATELEELVSFLSSPSPQITKAAVDIVRGLTGSDEGLHSLANHSKAVILALSRLLTAPKEVSEAAAEALVNLSQDSKLADEMVRLRLVETAMDVLYKPECCIIRLLVMLLVNLTQLDSGTASLLQSEDDKVRGLYVMKLVRSFCRSTHESNDDAFEHVGSILVNITKQRAGRELLLDPKRALLKQIIRQFDSNSLLRKKGSGCGEACYIQFLRFVNHFLEKWPIDDLVANLQSRISLFMVSGTVRNCCFEAENQLQNLLLVSEFLWPALLPVAGNKIYSEEDRLKMPLELGTALSIEREPVNDPEIRTQTLEAIYLIILQEAGRRAFWSINGPRIVQIGYEDEEDPKVMEAYERIGSLLVHGSGMEEPSTETAK